MFPVLVNLGPIPIHTYGFLIAVGFLVAVYTARRLAIRAKMNVDHVLDLMFWSLLVGFAGARILFVITELSHFLADPLDIFKVWEGGLVFYGGPIAIVPFIVWYTWRHQMQFWRTMDVLQPGVVIAHAFGRLGCLSVGCCYGRPTGGNWGIKFYSDLVDPSLRGVPLHPTQLYEASALAILFAGLLWVFRHKSFDGQVTLTYFMAYPVIRSIVEIFRGDTIRGFVIPGILSTSQFISIFVFLGAASALVWRLKQVKRGAVAS